MGDSIEKMSNTAPTCTRCGERQSTYFRPYSGERLCPRCFKDTIRGRVEKTIARYNMLEYDSRIAVGVSGGKDSLGLLHILKEIEGRFPKSELIAVSIDEGVEGYRDEALDIAAEACKGLDVEHIVMSFQDLFGVSMDEIAGMDRELSTCAYCGVFRRRALNMAAQRVEADRLATGHNLDDMAQTAMLNILRGDLSRFYMMNPGGSKLPGFVRRIKPFCEVPERESTLFAYYSGFRFQELPCPYAEEAMRNDIRGFLNRMEVKRPGTKFIIYSTAIKMTPEEQASGLVNTCSVCGEPSSGKICRVCQIIEELSR